MAQAWWESLPAVLAELAERWDLSVGEPVGRGNTSLVIRCRRADGRSAILKLTPEYTNDFPSHGVIVARPRPEPVSPEALGAPDPHEPREATAALHNVRQLIDELIRAKPSAAKGRYLRTVTVASTMGPGVKVDPTRTRDILGEGAETAATAA